MTLRLLLGHDAAVAEWMQSRLDVIFCPPYTAIGVVDDEGRLRGGAVFNGYTGHDVEVSLALDGVRLMPSVLRTVGAYVFDQLGCLRMSVRVRRSNWSMRRLLKPERGFRWEGMLRRHFGPKRDDDALLYGMMREDCRWIAHGKHAKSA